MCPVLPQCHDLSRPDDLNYLEHQIKLVRVYCWKVEPLPAWQVPPVDCLGHDVANRSSATPKRGLGLTPLRSPGWAAASW
jgi:hypothetical protein